MIRHVVMFRFKGDLSERLETAATFRNALIGLADIISELKSIEVGINENSRETWDLVLTATAETPDDVAAYSVHPAHVAAVNQIKEYIEARACVDYTA